MNQIDIILIGASLISAVVFFILGPSRLIKFYIGLLIGLLVCILINLKLNYIANIGVTANSLDSFFSKNRDFIGTTSLFVIPAMGILFLLNRSFIIQESEQNNSIGSMFGKFLMGLALVPLTLGMYSIIDSLGLSTNTLLSGLIESLKNSALLGYLSQFGHYVFLLLFGILFYKFVLKFLFLLLVYFLNRIRELRAEEREIRRRRKEGIDDDEEEEEEDTNQH